MKLYPEQLEEHLRRQLAAIYLLSGDEPLQLTEAADAVRQAAKAKGYDQRELFYVDASFDWGVLREARDSFSLFGGRRILDLRFPAKPDKDGGAALARYAERPPEDALLLITLPRMSYKEQAVRWFQALEKAAVLVQVWPPEGEQLLRWLDRRLNSRGLLADQSGLRLLAARVEGNLLAAAQEIEKLHILHGSGKLSDEQIQQAVADSTRFDVFALADEVLRGNAGRCYRILQGLRAEGVAAPVALWALTREVRSLLKARAAIGAGASTDSALTRVGIHDKRKPIAAAALQRLDTAALHAALLASAKADRIIKGAEPGEAWDALLGVCLDLTGRPRPAGH